MKVSTEEIRYRLRAEEPDYKKLAKLGKSVLPSLRKLVEEDDPNIASKAAYLASEIAGPKSAGLIKRAAGSVRPAVRAAAASALRNISPSASASATLNRLLTDRDPGVRRLAVRAARKHPSKGLDARLRRKQHDDSAAVVRLEAIRTIEEMAREHSG